MNEITIGSISLETFCHATEDLAKVETAIKNLCNFQDLKEEEIPISKNYVYGGYGNMIVFLKMDLTEDPLKDVAFNRIISQLPKADKIYLFKNFDRLLEKKAFFLRFNKQVAFLAGVTIGNEDSIRVCLKFHTGFMKKTQIPEILKDYCLSIHLIEKED